MVTSGLQGQTEAIAEGPSEQRASERSDPKGHGIKILLSNTVLFILLLLLNNINNMYFASLIN